MIRKYVEDYVKYYPDRWRWELKNTREQSERFMQTRARRSKEYSYKNADILPDFYSIERDAAQFELKDVEWTDFFGLTWKGKKGVFAYAGAPNYEGSLYYCDDSIEAYDISEEYDAYSHQPPEDIYTKIKQDCINVWIDTANIVHLKYMYTVNNHLFKDTYIDLEYDDGETITVYSEYKELINGLLKHGKGELLKNVFNSMNEHFIKLRDSDSEDVRSFFPGKTAEEMFLATK